MGPLATAGLVFAICFGAALLGMYLFVRLPDHHVDRASKDSVAVVMALVATMAALVLGLLISSANSSFETQNSNILQVVADVVEMDQALARYGAETMPVREQFRDMVADIHDMTWSKTGIRTQALDPALASKRATALFHELQALQPVNDIQREARDTALQLGRQIAHVRMQIFQRVNGQIPWPFFMVLVFWVAMLFLGFGLFTKMNPTVAIAMLIGAMSVASAVFLIMELNRPYSGLLQISDVPLRNAIGTLAR
jgi:hypothetical protein